MGGKVEYANEFPEFPLFPRKNDHLFLNLYFNKWDVWKHEDEFRLLHEYKTGNIQKVPRAAISEVILGCNFPETEKNTFLQEIVTSHPHVKIYQMELATDKFGLVKKIQYDERLVFKF